jgi:hypothetical protein
MDERRDLAILVLSLVAATCLAVFFFTPLGAASRTPEQLAQLALGMLEHALP